MRTYLFDASAAVHFYLSDSDKIRKTLKYIQEQKNPRGQAALFIPNFCIVEVFNTFARRHFRPSEKEGDKAIDRETYERCLKEFRDDIHWGKFLYPCDLNRYHIVAADKIIPIEHHLAFTDERAPLSTYDILVIAMACELAYIGRRAETFLITCDKRMKRVVDKMAAAGSDQFLIPGPLSDVAESRWIPPRCLYLPEVKPADLEDSLGRPH